MGCCSCCNCKEIKTDAKKDPQKLKLWTIDLATGSKNSTKPLSVLQKIQNLNEEKDISEHQMHGYKLNDLRSLEGVARLWSKKLETNKQLLLFQKSSSTPVIGNMYNTNNQLSPLTISTYFFHHTPANQINLLRSHSDHISATENNKTKKSNNDLSESLTPQLDMINENINWENRFKQANNNNNNNNNYYNNTAPNSGCSTPQKFSSISASNLQSPYLPNMNLSPLVSDDEFNFNGGIILEEDMEMEMVNMEMEIEIENDNENENDIFTVISEIENKNDFNLSNEDFIEHSSGKHSNIGVGASGIVKKAFHFSSCKMLAIKHCRSLKKEKLLAFEKEANLYKLLNTKKNSNIIEIIGIGRGNKNNELIMGLEFMDLNSCQSLNISVNISNIAKRELIVGYIAVNVLNGLKYLHSLLYVHNDIKPANILVNKYGEIKLSDFDTVLQLKNKTHLLNKNNGTQKYQSPEKIIFKTEYSCNSDIWSLGITLYELLFGEKIIENDHDEVSYTTNPPRLNSDSCGLSINCCKFINKCLIIQKHERPQSGQLLNDIWFKNDINCIALKDKWPWLYTPPPPQTQQPQYNDDLLFMINSLIQYYSTRKFSTAMKSKSASFPQLKINQFETKKHSQYSDEERIESMAKYAYCTKDTVLDRIRVTVAYIKSQLNKMDIQ